LGLTLRGTVGLVLAAKRAGRLTAARPVLERLRDSGMYLSDAVLNRALRLVAE
jgi:predicted nucleic acid-binding protein